MPRFKTDENIPISAVLVLRSSGHDVRTAVEQRLGGAADPDVLAMCRAEERALVTLDKDLSDIRAYPPSDYAGILVLRPRDQDAVTLAAVLARLLPLLDSEALGGALWIADEHRVRIRR